MRVLELKVPPAAVGQAIGGCINKVGAQAFNVIRTAWLTAGLSPDVACSTVDSQCGSSQFAVNLVSTGATNTIGRVGTGQFNSATPAGCYSNSSRSWSSTAPPS